MSRIQSWLPDCPDYHPPRLSGGLYRCVLSDSVHPHTAGDNASTGAADTASIGLALDSLVPGVQPLCALQREQVALKTIRHSGGDVPG